MATGILGAPQLLTVPGTDALVYQAPASVTGSVTVNFCNTTSGIVKVCLAAVLSGSTVALVNFLEKDVSIYPNESYRVSAVISNGQKLYGRTDTSGVAVNVYGFEE